MAYFVPENRSPRFEILMSSLLSARVEYGMFNEFNLGLENIKV